MKRLLIIIASLLVILMLIGYLAYNGYIWLNVPGKKEFPIRGIDVSNHQKVIDWPILKNKNNFTFVFIKATEGIDFKDRQFSLNWEESKKAGFVRGAYHFYTFKSKGVMQAKNFIETVPIEEGCLPPVIDIEFSGNSKLTPQKESLIVEITDFINEIEKHYKQTPILYVTYESYESYIKGNFNNCRIWIRDIIKLPKLSDKRQWSFWQYCNRGRILGINTFVDLNVFNGNIQEFEDLLKKGE